MSICVHVVCMKASEGLALEQSGIVAGNGE